VLDSEAVAPRERRGVLDLAGADVDRGDTVPEPREAVPDPPVAAGAVQDVAMRSDRLEQPCDERGVRLGHRRCRRAPELSREARVEGRVPVVGHGGR
jgi:hypothetical protein